MKPAKIASANVNEVFEVEVYLDTKKRIEDFKRRHAPIFEELALLIEEHNAALQQAEQHVRGREIKCGPFDLYQYQTRINAEKLHDAIGRNEFLKLGGVIGTQATYDIDKKALEAKIAQGLVPPSAVSAAVKVTPMYHVPEKLTLP